jgi:hypothetical protein
MDKHVCSLVVGIIRKEHSSRLGMVRVEGFDDLSSLIGSASAGVV